MGLVEKGKGALAKSCAFRFSERSGEWENYNYLYDELGHRRVL